MARGEMWGLARFWFVKGWRLGRWVYALSLCSGVSKSEIFDVGGNKGGGGILYDGLVFL